MGMNTGGTENHQECQDALGKNFILILSFHGVKIHFHHFHDLLEAMKICPFSQILKEPDFCSSLVRLYACDFCFVLFCFVNCVCFLRGTCLITFTRQTSQYFLLMH